MEKEEKNTNTLCYLCGKIIKNNTDDLDLKLSMDHVPPKQFFPKAIRQQYDLNLDLVPSHKKCNEDYRKDEEYFYHSMYPLVAENNPKMGQMIFQDLKRRTHKPQTPAMIRNILRNVSTVTQGGIHLPVGKAEWSLDEVRLQQNAIKIAHGVLALNNVAYIPESNCIDIRFYENKDEVIELYKLSWQASPIRGERPEIFSYQDVFINNKHLVNSLFWESFMYCLCFEKKTI